MADCFNLPARYDLCIYTGDTFRFTVVLKSNGVPIDLTGSQVAAEIRNSKTTVAFGIMTGAAPGQIDLLLSAAQTAALVSGESLSGFRWDLEITNGELVQTWLRGDVSVMRDVTQ
jgi:hypothetical protein